MLLIMSAESANSSASQEMSGPNGAELSSAQSYGSSLERVGQTIDNIDAALAANEGALALGSAGVQVDLESTNPNSDTKTTSAAPRHANHDMSWLDRHFPEKPGSEVTHRHTSTNTPTTDTSARRSSSRRAGLSNPASSSATSYSSQPQRTRSYTTSTTPQSARVGATTNMNAYWAPSRSNTVTMQPSPVIGQYSSPDVSPLQSFFPPKPANRTRTGKGYFGKAA